MYGIDLPAFFFAKWPPFKRKWGVKNCNAWILWELFQGCVDMLVSELPLEGFKRSYTHQKFIERIPKNMGLGQHVYNAFNSRLYTSFFLGLLFSSEEKTPNFPSTILNSSKYYGFFTSPEGGERESHAWSTYLPLQPNLPEIAVLSKGLPLTMLVSLNNTPKALSHHWAVLCETFHSSWLSA